MSVSTADLSVIIAVAHRADALPTLLSCLERQLLPASQYEVLIVSYVDDPLQQEVIHRYSVASPMQVRALQDAGGTEISAKNMGARYASGEWLLFLDQDLMPGTTLLGKHVQKQKSKGGRAIIMGGVRPHGNLPRGALTRWFMKEDRILMVVEQPDNPLHWSSRHCSLPRRTFLDDDGFSTAYASPRAADIDLACRMKSWKMPVQAFPKADAMIWHAVPFLEERRRFFIEGYDLHRLAENRGSLPIKQFFHLQSGRTQFWFDNLFTPFYERACQNAPLDVRVHGQSCRRIFTHDRRSGAQAARLEKSLEEEMETGYAL